MMEMKSYDERLRELYVMREVVLEACELKVIEIDVKINCILGLQNSQVKT